MGVLDLPMEVLVERFVENHNRFLSWFDISQSSVDSQESMRMCEVRMDYFKSRAVNYHAAIFKKTVEDYGYIQDDKGRYLEVSNGNS